MALVQRCATSTLAAQHCMQMGRDAALLEQLINGRGEMLPQGFGKHGSLQADRARKLAAKLAVS